MPASSNKTSNSTNSFTKALLVIYLILLCWILLFKLGVRFSYMSTRSVNLIPFSGSIDKVETILNILIFIPVGVYTGVLFKTWTWIKTTGFLLLLSAGFEMIQFIFRLGAFDSTDIVTNTSGGVAGLLLFTIIARLFNNSVRAHKFINIIAAAGTVIIIVLLLLLKLNLLPIRYQ